MIDKLDLRLPLGARFTREVRACVSESEFSSHGFRSRHYQSVTDLRPIGIDAILHKGLRRQGTGYSGSHKLEIIDAGWKGYSEWCATAEAVFEGDVQATGIMRIDTCADLFGVPVSWFLGRMRVKWKRSASGIGDSKWQTIGKRGIETITAGKRPNFLRVYDKVEECLQGFRKLQRRSKGKPLEKTFEEINGFAEGATVSRVERQHTSRGIPETLRTFKELVRVAEYDPFECLEIVDGVSPIDLLERDDLSLKQALEGMGVLALREFLGEQVATRWISHRSGGNFSRFKRDRPYLYGSENGSRMRERIVEEYRRSTMQQLSA